VPVRTFSSLIDKAESIGLGRQPETRTRIFYLSSATNGRSPPAKGNSDMNCSLGKAVTLSNRSRLPTIVPGNRIAQAKRAIPTAADPPPITCKLRKALGINAGGNGSRGSQRLPHRLDQIGNVRNVSKQAVGNIIEDIHK
jgi:hypothetical protein